ncbi:dethiobiotin synthase [Alkalimonas collagenimarina]|uniref:ATP-dependent dethiobiotin synthetase BioD n=1 Tax=Alkalimonas collagenimarina TaxID=400390 RepID=A0ABT9H274_9GAMM|nr:dethiobiotin synthase [Alkalimonas collagenimarina]MDP4537423.1 dethiobiotin synthase [Alkalimonas collagenimarina]
MHSFFVTGTDTDAGKTFVSTALLHGLAQAGKHCIAAKPIAAGVEADGKNQDAVILQQAANLVLPYELVNPILFAEPVAPHLAAARHQRVIDEQLLDQNLQQLQSYKADYLLVEGAGGWLLPISSERYLADWVIKQQLPVLLVVGVKLGCLNHAMLTVREIKRSGVPLLGWVGNCVDPDMALLQENIDDLQQRIAAPCLGVVPYCIDGEIPESINLKLASAVLQLSQAT